MDGEEFLTTEQAAAALKKHPLTLVVWRRRNVGPPFVRATDVRCVLYKKTDIFAWAERGRVETSSTQSNEKSAAATRRQRRRGPYGQRHAPVKRGEEPMDSS